MRRYTGFHGADTYYKTNAELFTEKPAGKWSKIEPWIYVALMFAAVTMLVCSDFWMNKDIFK